MDRILIAGMLLSVPAAFAVAQEAPQGAAPKPQLQLKTPRDQASYAIGLNIGRSLKRDGLDVGSAQLIQGLMDALSNAPAKLSDEQCRVALEALDKEMQRSMAEKNKVLSEKNRKEGAAFLAANKAKSGVVTLPSGLQYSVIKSGKGPSPKVTDQVRTHYHGTLIDGTVFDSSVQRNDPAVFAVGEVIRGWVEALQRMKVGDKWRLVVPSELAYGPDGFPPDIGPHAVLIFELELLGIENGQN